MWLLARIAQSNRFPTLRVGQTLVIQHPPHLTWRERWHTRYRHWLTWNYVFRRRYHLIGDLYLVHYRPKRDLPIGSANGPHIGETPGATRGPNGRGMGSSHALPDSPHAQFDRIRPGERLQRLEWPGSTDESAR